LGEVRLVKWTTAHWGEFWSCEKEISDNDSGCKDNSLSLTEVTFQGFGLVLGGLTTGFVVLGGRTGPRSDLRSFTKE